jgi:hypothetical protein
LNSNRPRARKVRGSKGENIMKRLGLALLCAALAGAAGAQTSMFLSPKGAFSTSFYSLEYNPSKACSRPMRPFSDSEFSRKMYLNDAERYLDCIRSAAKSDIEYATAVVVDGHKKEADDFLAEVRRR